MALRTKFVFIDTQSFVKANLDFESKILKAFSKACEEEELIHLMSSITLREVKEKIHTAIDDGLGSINQFRRKAKILKLLQMK